MAKSCSFFCHRGHGQAFVTLDEGSLLPEARAEEVVRLDEALTELETLNTRQSKIVEYRFFTGLTHEEIAELLSVSVPTVRRDWRFCQGLAESGVEFTVEQKCRAKKRVSVSL